MIARFGDPERGGFFSTSDDHEELIARRKEIGDHPIPSGNCAAALGLLRLAALSGERAYERPGRGRLPPLRQDRPPATPTPSPTCCGRSTSTSPRPRRSPWSASDLERPGRRRPRQPPPPPRPRRRPRGDATPPSCSASAPTVDGEPAAYVCENFSCRAACDRRSSSSPPRSEKDRHRVKGSWFTFAAGRRAKWVVFAIWFVAIFIAAGPAEPARQSSKTPKTTRRPPTCPESAESTQALDATEDAAEGRNRPRRDHLPARLRADRRRPPHDRRRRRQDDREALPGRDPRRRHRRRRRQDREGVRSRARSPAPGG